MPEQDDELVRTKYGLKTEKISPFRHRNGSCEFNRNYPLESRTLLEQVEKVAKSFLSQDVNIVDNNSPNAEEFCTIIELCLDHGFRADSSAFVSKKTGSFWTVLENHDRKKESTANQSAFEIVKKHLSLPNEKSKLRAWIKIGLTKKMLTLEIKESIRVIQKIDKCFQDWAFVRSEHFATFLTIIDGLNDRIDFNFVVKERLLNLSNKAINWRGLIDTDGLHLEAIAPYLRLKLPNDGGDKEEVYSVDKTLIRQMGFLEDENSRLRKTILVQLNENAMLENRLADLQAKKDQTDSYVKTLEEEVQRLNRLKYELEEEASARELQNRMLLSQIQPE